MEENNRDSDIALMTDDRSFTKAIWNKELKNAQNIAFIKLGCMKRAQAVMDAFLGKSK